MGDTTETPAREWYDNHRADYKAVKGRLAACRNVMLRGRREAAASMLEKAAVNAVLSIQTDRERHERAFTMYYAGDTSLATAAGETVYGNQKTDWLRESLATVNFGTAVDTLRTEGRTATLEYLVENFKGLSWVKASFALAMVGMWELACPDSRTKKVLGIEERIQSRAAYESALAEIDAYLDIDEPLFIKQWVMYDLEAEEHARHMPFFTEVLSYG